MKEPSMSDLIAAAYRRDPEAMHRATLELLEQCVVNGNRKPGDPEPAGMLGYDPYNHRGSKG